MSRFDESYYTLPEDFRIKSLDEMNSLNYSQYEGMITYFSDDKDIPDPMRSVEDLQKVHEKAPIYYGRGGEKYGASAHLTKEARENNDIDEDAKAVVKETASSSDSYGYSTLGGIDASYLSSFLEEEDEEEIEEETEVVLLDEDGSVSANETPQNTESDQVISKPEIRETITAPVSEPEVKETFTAPANKPTMTINPRYTAIKNSSVNTSHNDFVDETPYVAKVPVNSIDQKADSAFSLLVSYGIAFLVACGLAFVILKFVAMPSILSGTSMSNTINDGDKIVVEKVSYRIGEPKRYDLVEFQGPDGTDYVKRIIGMPGEYLTVSEGYIYVNGELLSDDIYGKECINKDNYGRLKNGVLLDTNEYFVVGDNRNDSLDSRDESVGNLYLGRIKGKVCFKLWPPEPIE